MNWKERIVVIGGVGMMLLLATAIAGLVALGVAVCRSFT